ncbi:hypothetical protein LOK49_LG02G02519 [Camellia lanceoleosa]|uniref:Uncharacterized protein n=1 Tax=Camellia lanceoleosa TaxID=1840588 RepID=A0ACC0IT00_9ERIC|nr:hypothetical protein LOK49_LG02G02519 [Camellia lanceoleosa]
MPKSMNERSNDIVGIGGCDDNDGFGRLDDDDDQWKNTKQMRHGFGRNLKKAKRVTRFRFRKAKKQLLLRKNTRAGGSGGGCYCYFKQTLSLDSPVDSQTSDPNSPEFTYELLRALIENNDFSSNECNLRLDLDNKDVN